MKISWKDMQEKYVGKKYRGRINIPGLNAKTLLVVDVNLGGDVVIAVRGYGNRNVFPQDQFLKWLKNAKMIKE